MRTLGTLETVLSLTGIYNPAPTILALPPFSEIGGLIAQGAANALPTQRALQGCVKAVISPHAGLRYVYTSFKPEKVSFRNKVAS